MRPVVRHTAAGLLVLAVVACSTAVEAATQMTITQTYAAHKSKANPKEVFATAIKDNLYHTPNYFIGAYHYVQCYANALIEPSNTRETADAVMFYYKKTHAGQPVTFRTSRPMFHTSTKVCAVLCSVLWCTVLRELATRRGAFRCIPALCCTSVLIHACPHMAVWFCNTRASNMWMTLHAKSNDWVCFSTC